MQTPSFDWPTEFLVVVVTLFVLAIGAPWMPIVRRLQLTARDATDKELSEGHVEVMQDSGWKKLSGRCLVPDNAKTLKIAGGPLGAAGIVDIDDVVVEFK